MSDPCEFLPKTLVAELRSTDVHDIMHKLSPLTVFKLLERAAAALEASEKLLIVMDCTCDDRALQAERLALRKALEETAHK